MFKGTMKYWAEMLGLRFDAVEVELNEPGVEKVVLESLKAGLTLTVHLACVPSKEEGMATTERAVDRILNRLAFNYLQAIGKPMVVGRWFAPTAPPSEGHQVASVGFANVRVTAAVAVGVATVNPPQLKAELEQPSPPGEHHYGLFRSAMNSSSQTEKFVHLYNVLLMLFDDKQEDVDVFIVGQEPSVKQTPDPPDSPKRKRKKSKTDWKETIYTRLRNEMGHPRMGVNLDETKREMADQVHGLIKLVKRAIEVKA
jgi:hypothetical protein